jgi:hypothetical protein
MAERQLDPEVLAAIAAAAELEGGAGATAAPPGIAPGSPPGPPTPMGAGPVPAPPSGAPGLPPAGPPPMGIPGFPSTDPSLLTQLLAQDHEALGAAQAQSLQIAAQQMGLQGANPFEGYAETGMPFPPMVPPGASAPAGVGAAPPLAPPPGIPAMGAGLGAMA